MEHHVVLRVISKVLLPFILLFALYVQFHGDYGPGGGFQAGVIFAAGFILYGLIYGLDNLNRVIAPDVTRVLAALGVLIYGGTGVVGMLLGGEYLDYNHLAHDAKHGQHYGILIVEFGVGLTVASVMIGLAQLFASPDADD